MNILEDLDNIRIQIGGAILEIFSGSATVEEAFVAMEKESNELLVRFGDTYK